jgi:hypothetical protein
MNEINYDIYIFTTKYVMKNGSPIVRVLHDEDGDWQFLGNEGNLQETDAMVVSLEEIIEFDTTLSEIIDLPIGKQALRNNIGEPWYIYNL